MSNRTEFGREHILYVILAGIFITNALLAELIGVKIFSLESVFGLRPLDLTLFGQSGLSFSLTAGVVLWPVVFILTDLINEYFGPRGVKRLSYFTIILIFYAFIAISLTIAAPPAAFWPESHLSADLPADSFKREILNYDSAFRLVFGQGRFIIIGSMIAFLVGQLLDVFVFHRIKKATGEKGIWLRATGSTVVSQLVDSFIVLFVAFYIGAGWDIRLVLAIGVVNYLYKFTVALAITPLLYLCHFWIDRYLGEPLATKMKQDAMRH